MLSQSKSIKRFGGFEQQNRDLLKKCSETVSRVVSTIAEAKTQIQTSIDLIEKTHALSRDLKLRRANRLSNKKNPTRSKIGSAQSLGQTLCGQEHLKKNTQKLISAVLHQASQSRPATAIAGTADFPRRRTASTVRYL